MVPVAGRCLGVGIAIAMACGAANGADVRVLSSAAIKPAFDVLGPQFERATKNRLVINYVLTPAVPKMIESGDVFDVAVANPPHIDALIKSGKVAAGSRAQISRFGLGLGTKAGTSKPDVSTADAFKQTLLKAQSLAYVGAGTSGPFAIAMLTKLGILDQMKSKLRPGGVAENLAAVANGETELVIMPVPLILAAKGVALAGALPAEFQDHIVLTGGIAGAAPQGAAAQAFIKHVMAREADAVFKSTGYDRVAN
jgi:molybdate transport system substrate-binding protein